MKRKTTNEGDKPNKKQRTQDPENKVLQTLPVEIWQTILELEESGGEYGMKIKLIQQCRLRLASKYLNAMVVKIWHSVSARMWPQFYLIHMKHFPSDVFVPLYSKMMIFSCSYLQKHEKKPERFGNKQCPVCNNKIKKFSADTEEGRYYACCKTCTKEYGTKLEWKFYCDLFECSICHTVTPFTVFDCENCDASFCFRCRNSEDEVRYLGPVDGNWDTRYCTDCVENCQHCDEENGTVEGNCHRCKKPQCAFCEQYQSCENSVEEDEDNEEDESESTSNVQAATIEDE